MMNEITSEAIKVLEVEANAILALKDRIGDSFNKAVEVVFGCEGKLIVTGIGKSGQIGRKLASTFASTGTPAMFMHPAESSHGDMGMIAKGDVVLAISYGGDSPELADLLRFVARKNIPLIAMTGNKDGSLAKASICSLDVSVSEEACPLGLAPTASSTATLAFGDALAMAVLKKRGFKSEDFAELHPGGSLGRKLLTRVADVMHSGESMPVVNQSTAMRQVLSIMTAKDVRGVAGVIDDKGDLIGVVTDGDIRRRLEKSQDPLAGTALDIMNRNPKTIDAGELAQKALFVMEQFSIQLLFVVDKNSSSAKKPVGVIHVQDLLKSRIK